MPRCFVRPTMTRKDHLSDAIKGHDASLERIQRLLQSDQNDWYWKVRPFIVGLAIFFVSAGVRNLAGRTYDHRHIWELSFLRVDYTFFQDRFTLLCHLVPSVGFLATSIAQKELLPWVAVNPRTRILVHRYVGRVCLICSVLGALASLSLCFGALYGTAIGYIPWTFAWLFASVKTFTTVRSGLLEQHRAWAQVLFQISFMFVSARCLIMLLATVVPKQLAYQAGILLSGLLAKLMIFRAWRRLS